MLETSGDHPTLQETVTGLRSCIAGAGHNLYGIHEVDHSAWPRLWLPSVYIRVTDAAANIGDPAPDIPSSALKVAVLASAQDLPGDVNPQWDMVVAVGDLSSPVRLPPGYQGWFVVPDALTLFAAADIRARSHHLRRFEAEAMQPAESTYKISVVICSYQRHDSAVEAVLSAADQSLAAGEFEVIVVNNDEADTTLATRLEDIRHSHFAGCPERLRLVSCPLLGLSHARNAGISEARGEIVCFLDDDALATHTWLEQTWTAFLDHPDAGVIGGTIRLRVPSPRPAALLPGSEIYWSQMVPEQEREYIQAQYWWEFPWGANWSARRSTLLQVGGFRTRYGRRGNNFAGGEEVAAASLVDRLGYEIGIAPAAEVIHNVDVSRYTWHHIRHAITRGVLTNYYLQRDFYLPMTTSMKATLNNIWNAPVYPVIKGSKVDITRHRLYQKLGYLYVLWHQLQDWMHRRRKPIAVDFPKMTG
jgi:glycosyltransferase involved in cell wall biosynthesis